MTRTVTFRAVLLSALLAVVVSGCATSIRQVMADPSHYRNKEVRVSGHVADSYSIVGRGAYRLEDDSGQLWVVSDRGVPRKGAHVTVRGTIREGFDLGGLQDRIRLPIGGVVLVETEHHLK